MTTKTINLNLPAISIDGGLSNYLTQIKKFPILDPKEEYMLAKRWKKRGDLKSAQKLITSHLRLVAKIAMGYRGYGLPVNEMISEGNIGLMQAVKKFEPEKGFKLATYAMWWIKASIQEYILKSWSLVKMGTTSAQKKLFFNLKKIRRVAWHLWNGRFPCSLQRRGFPRSTESSARRFLTKKFLLMEQAAGRQRRSDQSTARIPFP